MSGWKRGLEPGKLKLNLMRWDSKGRLKKEVLKQAIAILVSLISISNYNFSFLI